MKVLIVTGGTGGHIYPALSFADLIKDRYKDAEILFVGNQGRMESSLVPKASYAFVGLNTKSITGSIFHRLIGYVQLFQHSQQIDEIFKTFKPDWCIGFGGYVSVPVLNHAFKLKVPYFIHEQNAFVGKANRLLSKHAQSVFASYQENLKVLPINKSFIYGNPRSYSIKSKADKTILKDLGLSSKKKTVLFVMGSQGAESLYDLSIKVMHNLDQEDVQCIFVTGQKYFDEFLKRCKDTENIKIVPYIDQISAMREIDLMVTRGGATTASEIALLGIPSIIVPSPFVPNNHQYYNAKALNDAKAARLFEENKLSFEGLTQSILELLNNAELRKEMSLSALNMAKPQAAQDMLDHIMKEISYE